MNLRILLLTALLPASAHAGPRTSANYNVATDSADAGGKRATSASYTNDGGAGGSKTGNGDRERAKRCGACQL